MKILEVSEPSYEYETERCGCMGMNLLHLKNRSNRKQVMRKKVGAEGSLT